MATPETLNVIDEKPTQIEIFRYKPNTLSDSRIFYNELRDFVRAVDANSRFWVAQDSRVISSIDRIETHLGEIFPEITSLRSSITTSLAYLKFKEDFQKQGVAEADIFSFFKICLDLNKSAHTGLNGRNKKGTDATLNNEIAKAISKDSFVKRDLESAIISLKHQVPSWFKGKEDAYARLIKQYMNFPLLLNPDLRNLSQEEIIRKANLISTTFRNNGTILDPYGSTYPGGEPDWFNDCINGMPNEADILEELSDDQESELVLRRKIEGLIKQKNQIRTSTLEKSEKTQSWLRKRIGGIITGIEKNLGNFSLFYSIMPGGREILNLSATRSAGVIIEPETLSLWVESIFKTAGIVDFEHALLVPEVANLFNVYLEGIRKESPEAESKFRMMRDINKRGYNELNFDLGPLVAALPDDKVTLLKEFIGECEPKDYSKLITFIGDMLSEELNNGSIKAYQPDISRSIEAYRVFTKRLISRNLEWLSEKYLEHLFPERTTIRYEEPASEPDIKVLEKYSEPAQIISQFEDELVRIRKGELVDWQVLYALDRNNPESKLVEISGDSADEKAEFFQDFLANQGISCSVKPTSIISALEWKTVVPEAIEHLVIRKDIEGTRWKKIKRGAVRIFYRMDSTEQKIVFFVHQKNQDAYGF